MIFRGENVKILQLCVTLQRKNQPTATFDRTPPPPGQQLFPKLGKMWWVVSQIWLNSDSNELSQSWVRLVNLGFELSPSFFSKIHRHPWTGDQECPLPRTQRRKETLR